MSWEVRTMRSATSYFNFTLLRKNVARFWPIWSLYGLFCWRCCPSIFCPTGYIGTGEWPAACP